MHDIFRFTGDFPDWQAGADKRLGFSMVLAAVMLAGMLSLARLPAPGEFGPILELAVELIRPQPVVQPEPDILPRRRLPKSSRSRSRRRPFPNHRVSPHPQKNRPLVKALPSTGMSNATKRSRKFSMLLPAKRPTA